MSVHEQFFKHISLPKSDAHVALVLFCFVILTPNIRPWFFLPRLHIFSRVDDLHFSVRFFCNHLSELIILTIHTMPGETHVHDPGKNPPWFGVGVFSW